ncbi:MAG: DUF1566 domain-containing protein [Chromatiales bacterium]|nr:DUF1566 domain-containing protein [Chromatiales bacterium]
MYKRIVWALYVGALCLPSATLADVTCNNENTQMSESTPSADFIINNDGTVTHVKTGLMWMRCSLGQTWNGTDCSTGSVMSYQWQSALQTVEAINSGQSDQDGDQFAGYAGYEDWRLPNKNELESIVEPRCWSPAVNAEIFPNARSYWYWSSTRHTFSSSMAWRVDFDAGSVGTWHKTNYYGVRLVRTAQ